MSPALRSPAGLPKSGKALVARMLSTSFVAIQFLGSLLLSVPAFAVESTQAHAPAATSTMSAPAAEPALKDQAQAEVGTTSAPQTEAPKTDDPTAVQGNQATSVAKITSTDETAPKKPWALALGLGRTNSLYNLEDGNAQASWDFSMAPSFKLSPDYKLSFLVEYSQDINGNDVDFGRGNMTLSKSSGFDGFNGRVKLIPRFGVGFPLSETAKASSLYASTSAAGHLEANSDYLFSKKLGLALDISLGRNFHKYDTAVSGKINTLWSSVQSVEVSWNFTDDLSFGVTATHNNSQTYQGYQSEGFSHGEKIGLKLSPKWSAAVGHQWGAPYAPGRKANGRDINFELTDEQNSLVYAQINLTL